MPRTPPPLPDITAAMRFDEAARVVTAYLGDVMPWGAWSVSRVADEVQTHVVVDDRGYGLERGTTVLLGETLCQHMLSGAEPAVATDVSRHALYAPLARPLDIAAYAGVPIRESDGTLFGVLCGLSRAPQAPEDHASEPLLRLLAGLLGIVLAADRGREQAAADLASAQVAASTDDLTGLPNRRAWTVAVQAEADRHARFADPTAVAIVDLDRLKAVNDQEGHTAGDALLRRAASTLRASLDDRHLVARLGGDEFALLLRQTGVAEAALLAAELEAALDAVDAPASIGWAPVQLAGGISAALRTADEAMYTAKRCRADARRASPAARSLLPEVATGMAFDEAAQRVVAYLREPRPHLTWSVSRIVGDVQAHLVVDGADGTSSAGDQFDLADTICGRMLDGSGPPVASDVRLVPAYASRPPARLGRVRSYAGIPIREEDGGLFGVLCGISPAATDPAASADDVRLLRLLADLLGSVLASDRHRHAGERALLADDGRATDPVTGLLDPGGWRALVAHEQIAVRRFGDPAAVVVLPLGDVAPAVVAGCASVLSRTAGASVVVWHPGPGQLGLLLTGGDAQQAAVHVAAAAAALAALGLPVEPEVRPLAAADLAPTG